MIYLYDSKRQSDLAMLWGFYFPKIRIMPSFMKIKP